MKLSLITFSCLVVFLSSCKKDAALPGPQNQTTVCGTPGWPQGNWKVKFVVSGLTSPDSANFNINMGKTQFGTHYYKTFINPTLTLSDSVHFCGDKNSDIILEVYNQDTTQTFTTKIYVNDSLVIQQTGYGNMFTVGGCK